MNGQRLPKVMVRPYYVCVAGPWRLLKWGVFETAREAASKADEMCKGGSQEFRREITVERIYVSRRQR